MISTPTMDNSLLREHHGLILDLMVQGQDVLINERALWEEETDRMWALIHTVGGQGCEAGYAPPPTQQMGKAPSNLFRKGSATVTEQMSHCRTMLAAPATGNKAACSKAFLSQGLVSGDMFTEISPASLSVLLTRDKAPVGC